MNEIRIFEVGGSIRNELLGRPAKDRDFSVLAPDFQTMRQYLLDMGCTFYQERPQFVAIRAKHPVVGAADFTLARKESFYTDARHPDSVTPAKTIEEDLARRDFRMNAIAREVGSKELIDPHCGQLDIIDKVVSPVGRAKDRFDEDRLRMFRAIRFACQLGFEIDQDITDAIHKFGVTHFDAVTKEMIQVELCKAFAANSYRAANYLFQFPILWRVIEERNIWLRPTLEEKP